MALTDDILVLFGVNSLLLLRADTKPLPVLQQPTAGDAKR
jgi:hypothetical protein